MELDRPHPHRPPAPPSTTTSDLFICFSSRPSKSSAMRASKSIISPGRTDKPPISLPASLSRRLRSKNGSLKGGQSPMFPPQGVVVSKKRGGCAIENNPEPSSPKVTCIGQVRVKTKKHGKKMKMNMSRAYRGRRSGSGRGDHGMQRVEGEGCLQHRNQRWVHLPMTICDALKGFGSEFNSCFSPCRPSSCFTSSEVKGNRHQQQLQQQQQQKREDGSSSSCGGSVCRWLVAMHEGEGGRARDIELVVGEEEERVVVMERECSRRRSVFDDMDFNVDEICEVGNEIGGGEEQAEEEEEAARMSICIPPKNALLLMRCRSDPVKMSALSHKFCWDQEGDGLADEGMRRRSSVSEYEKIESLVTKPIKVEPLSTSAKGEGEQKRHVEEKEESRQSTEQRLEVVDSEEQQQQSAEPEMYEELIQEEKLQQKRYSVDSKDMSHVRVFPDGIVEETNRATEVVAPRSQSPDPLELKKDIERNSFEIDQQTVVGKVSIFEQHEEDIQPPSLLEEEQEENLEEEEEEEEEEIKSEHELIEVPREDDDKMEEAGEEEGAALPDCLLLMMCEPKLSMEVSKETWVCSTDFIRCLPERHRQHHLKKINPTKAESEPTTTTNTNSKNKKKKNTSNTTTKSNIPPPAPPGRLIPAAAQLPLQPQGLQPPRSSCSFPIASGAKEKKRVSYEPLALTRCKSAPMRSATAKLAPPSELACSWKNRKIEPHRPATCGVGAAGIGC